MVSTRRGTVLKDSNKQVAKNAKAPQPPTNKKRKAEDAPTMEENKENHNTPGKKENVTPPPADCKGSAEPKPYEKTPGRDGPVKKEDRSLSPKIKPFRGPPGKKVRKTFWEKEEEYGQFALENEGHTFHELHVCHAKGPKGSPTYDKSGFQLDYHKVADWMKPTPYDKRAMVNGMERALEKGRKERDRMAEIFFEKGEAPTEEYYTRNADYWKDRVSKDLNVPWHKVGVPEFEKWEKKGFKKARKGEYENFSEEEKERMGRLHDGSALRK